MNSLSYLPKEYYFAKGRRINIFFRYINLSYRAALIMILKDED